MLWRFIKEHTKGFWPGFIGGFGVWGTVLFPAKIFLSSVVLAALGKIMMVGALAMVTGLCKVLGEDLYNKMKQKYNSRKNKRNERTRPNKKEKRA